jgi:predicted acetyltransferase
MGVVETGLAPLDHPLLLLLASPRRAQFRMGDGLWIRLVDLPAALNGRSYGEGDPLVLEVHDAICDWNDGRWRLDAGECARTDEEPDLFLDVSALGSAYLGAVSFAQLREALRVEERRKGAVADADALFAYRPLPWCLEIF